MITSVRKWGNSQGIRIPLNFLNALGISVDDSVELSAVDNAIVIKKFEQKPEITFASLFSGYSGEGAQAYGWGPAAGVEIL